MTPTLSLAYTYDPVGNITTITDTTRSEVNHYAYDSLDRLTWITTTTGSSLVYQQLYTYDAVGNILSTGSQGERIIDMARSAHECTEVPAHSTWTHGPSVHQ